MFVDHRFGSRSGSFILFSFILFFSICIMISCDMGGGFTDRDSVKQHILDNVIKPSSVSTEIIAYLGDDALAAGDTVWPAGDPDSFTVITEPTWLAWIDDEPDAEFWHETRFVFVKVADGTTETQVQGFYPLIGFDEIDLFYDITEEDLKKRVIFSSISE